MTLYGVDVASYQGTVNWPAVVSSGIRFAFSKVTQSTNYVNSTWARNKTGMKNVSPGMLPGAYHFLTAGTDPKAQAQYFHSKAGDMSEYAVALDVEPTENSRPTAGQAKAWVDEYKRLSGGHPVIGYFPGWYWQQLGQPSLSFFDTLWQSHYVNGSGSASALYAKVSASWWATYGNEPVSILQYSSSGVVTGISGQCDVNAFRGTLDELRAIALGGDMALTEEDITRIATAVWKKDGLIEAPPNAVAEGNTHWTAGSYEYWGYQQGSSILAMVTEMAKQSPDMDEDRIIAGVLAGLGPEALADKIATHLAPEVARGVLDALKERLES